MFCIFVQLRSLVTGDEEGRVRRSNSQVLKANVYVQQFGSMPVLEEAKTMVYVTNHNMITMAMVIFKTYKMADKGEEKKEF